MTLAEYGRKYLLEPIGFKNFTWQATIDGSTLGSWGILTTPRELAKVGQLVLDKGKYQGRQIVPESWISEVLTTKVPQADMGYEFGYL